MKTPGPLRLTSGLALADPLDRLLAFCAAEYAYYDAIPSNLPNRIEPIDILATVSMNSFVDSAGRVWSVLQGLAGACEPILGQTPEDADVRTFDLARAGHVQRRLPTAATLFPGRRREVADWGVVRSNRGSPRRG